ncbi:MAG TPA: ABC transporter substrate-binding protein [Acidimicrobiales bacterium]|nr:ABC transporter substrate-binding protein [Acidimicrobiales bacterium]
MRKSTTTKLLAVLFAIGLVAAACGDSDEGSPDTTGGSNVTTPGTTLAPVAGGSVTIGQFSREGGLDPAKLAGGGTVGGTEGAAMFDVLMKYNAATGGYEGGTAESLTSNADFTEWTMKLRPNIKFGDGTPYDAAAVKWVLERQMLAGNSAPRSQLTGAIDAKISGTPPAITDSGITIVDPLTLKFKAKKSWAGFPYIFVGVNGLIYSKAAFERIGAEGFNVNPGNAGAGPFILKSYRPGEVIEMEKNPNYWGGTVYLDTLKFVYIAGPSATYDAIKTGTLQGGFIRDPVVYAQAKADKYSTVDMPTVAGNIINMNSGIQVTCAGAATASVPSCQGVADGTRVTTKTATSNKNVRLAVAHAVDPKVINDRVYEGKAVVDSAPFANFQWDPKVEGPKADQAEARRLVALAKTEGWDGKIRVAAGNDPVGLAWAEAVATQLQAVGMEVTKQTEEDITGVVNRVLVRRDFDLTTWAYGLLDESDNNYNQLVSTFASANPRYGYGNAEMDAAIDLLRTADTDAKKIEGYKKISEIWVRDMPAHTIAIIPQAIVHTPKLHDIVRTGSSITLYGKAWLEK